ncbi:MAG: 16S rRNA (guanine(966)-N(2))-methyltransferase RsmD [Bacteroidetes bacterium GWF2_40_14]|nr:MAG: 16S rRNA (guanine(966)-N(2))-methyltransferase RsmD [Bacteroidetes bacterium GWF2_40_14]
MRIIGGDMRGKTISPPVNYKARPTTDFAKEGLFNVLANQYDFSEVAFLDLFSGTGSISFEFASRGCTTITSVEMNAVHAAFIKSTAAKFGIEGMQVVRHNVFDFLEICNQQYDIVFADPPYDIAGFGGIPEKILSRPIFKDGGILVFEHPAGFNYEANPFFTKEKKYGNVHFSFFEKK